ncbi:hypothetical protein Mapa_012805 [Marchantia paleacea]|nr:hypothetical protein Mapa_012805 [Marchantia paleacea]
MTVSWTFSRIVFVQEGTSDFVNSKESTIGGKRCCQCLTSTIITYARTEPISLWICNFNEDFEFTLNSVIHHFCPFQLTKCLEDH